MGELGHIQALLRENESGHKAGGESGETKSCLACRYLSTVSLFVSTAAVSSVTVWGLGTRQTYISKCVL